jgi:succinate dehydrogenase / fumarate reductase flavoprotein subunit
LDISADGMSTTVPNLFVAGEAVGGIHGRNRLMGNSLLDIIVFGRNAGKSVGKIYKDIEVKELTLDHVKAFDKELKDAGIDSNVLSPKLLPNYTKQPNV